MVGGRYLGFFNLPSRLENCEDPKVKEEYRPVTCEGTGAPRQSNLGMVKSSTVPPIRAGTWVHAAKLL